MIQINPLKSYIDGGVRAALTTPPSASLVFDLPGKAIWVKGVKLKGTDHTYTFSHDNYITLTNTPDSNESEDIKIGVNTSALKNAIDTTYGVVSTTANGLAPKFTSGNKLAAAAATTYYFLGWAGTTLKWYQAPFRNIRINSETTDCLGVNNTDPLIISSGNGISVTWDSTNKKIIITNTKPDINHNTDTKVALSVTTLNKNYAIILKGNDSDEGSITTVNFSTYLKFNPSTKQLTINGNKVITTIDTFVGATTSADGSVGLVTKPLIANRLLFLRGDGTWATPVDTWRPVKVEGTEKLGSNALDLSAGNGISIIYNSDTKKIIITNTKPDVNHNTHYTTMLYIGENNDTKANKNVANPYLKLFDDNARRATFQIKAGSGIAVASDANGNITITNSSPDVNHNTDRTGIKLTTVSGTKKTDSTLILANSTTGLNIQGGTNKFLIGNGTNYIEVPVVPSVSNKDATIGTALTTIATIAGVDIKAKIASYSLSNHTHSVKINGSTKTIAASGAVDLGNYLPLSGGTMSGTAWIVWPDSGNWGNNNSGVTFPVTRGGLQWSGLSDYVKLFSEEISSDNLNLVLQFGDDNSNGLSIRNKANTQTSYISSSGVITTGTFKGNLDWSYITNKPSSYTPSAHTHAWNSLTHSSTTENQAILTNGKANGWKLLTLNIARWDNAANNAHSHSNKSVLDGITSGLVNNWNTAYNFVNTISGTDTDKVINKWDEIVNFLAGITEDNKLNTLLNSKLSILLLSTKDILTTKTNNALFWVNTIGTASSITTGPFTDHPYALLSVTNYSQNDTNGKFFYRSRLAFSSAGDLKVASCHHQGEYKLDDTWYNVLTSKNSGINGSTIKLNGTSITVYSSSTADGRFVKKAGDTMSGALTINTTGFGALIIKRNDDANGASIQFRGKSNVYGYIGLNNSTKDKLFLRWNSDTSKTYIILDTSSTYVSSGKGIINGTTITQVDNAINSTNSTNARKLVNWYSTRPTSLNTQFGDGSLRIFYATSSTTEGKSPDDATILHLSWDNNGGWDSQLGISAPSGRIYSRAQNKGTWQSWKTLAFTTDIPTALKNPHALTISLNGTSQGPYDGSIAKSINITPSSIGASSSSHTHAYLPLSGGTMTGNIKYTEKGTSYIGNGENDAANGVGGALNNLVISSWYGISFTTSCSGQTYTNKNAVSINCRNGYVYANTFVGTFNGNASTATKLTSSAGNAALPIYFLDGKPIACNASSIFSNLSNNGNNLSITIAGLNRLLTIAYASTTSKLISRGNLAAYEEGSTTKGESGVNFYTVYNNGYPVTYGNLLHINGSGAGQLLAEWCGNATLGHLYYRSKRDNSEHGWSTWGKIAFVTDNVATASKWLTARKITLSGSVTGSISIDGSGDVTLTTTTNHTHNWTNIEGKPSTFTPSAHTHNYITISTCSTLDENSNNFSVEYAGGSNSVATKPSGVDAFSVMKLRTASGWYGLILMSNSKGIYYRSANGLTSSVNWIKLLDSSNSNVSGGGSVWGSSITVNINGTSKTLTIPGNPNTDYRVTQSETTTANYRPLVLGYTNVSTAGSGMTGSVTNQVYLSNKFYVQPSTGNLYATNFVGTLSGNATTATTLQTARTIWGLSFNGSNNVSGNMSGVGLITFSSLTGTNGRALLYLPMADNDFFRIYVGATASDAGYVEIATADGGNEPIYVRQYTGVFSSVKRTLTLLDANGYTHFPSYINIGGNENNNSSPDRVWGSNGSDSYLRSYRTSALRVSYANSAGNADTLDGVHLNGIFTTFLANGNATRLVIGGVTKDLTIPYSIKSNLLYSYSLPYTNHDKIGWYCKIASVSITSLYSSKTALLCITDEYTVTSSSARYGLIYIKMQQQNALGSSPNVVIRVSGSLTTSLVIGILTLSSTTSKLDIYLKEDLSYLRGYISFIHGALDIRTNSLELIQTLPSGTIINSQYGDISNQSASLLNSYKINGTSFNGTSDITTAYWGATRTISLTGAVIGSVSTNGSGNITINTTYGTGNITNLDSRYVNVTGDTMTGPLQLNGSPSQGNPPLQINYTSNFEPSDLTIGLLKFGKLTTHDMYLGISPTTRTHFGRVGYFMHVNSSCEFTWASSGWTNLMALAGGTGNLWVKGSITAGSFIKSGSSNDYVLLGGGGHKSISDFMLKTDELSNNLTIISKSLTVTQAWMDTGIKNTDLPANGTYIVQVSANNTADSIWSNYWSGIMSWYTGGTNDNEADEIILHRAGHAYHHTIYLRTIMTTSSDGRHLRLQIAADTNLSTAVTYTFKFKRVI